MAHGIRQGILESVPKMCGKELEKEGAACMAAKWTLPMLSLELCESAESCSREDDLTIR